MKIRNGFVSNSSSSSFVINKSELTREQIYLIHDACLEPGFDADPWLITETETTVEGFTSLDNFSMADYFDKIGIPEDKIEWND
ncbi:MAG TPA: hypothetical protein VI911_10215 [Patescibacteria group bacterium]|nr:hypothetical protein [Patescibacteria group bacterium]